MWFIFLQEQDSRGRKWLFHQCGVWLSYCCLAMLMLVSCWISFILFWVWTHVKQNPLREQRWVFLGAVGLVTVPPWSDWAGSGFPNGFNSRQEEACGRSRSVCALSSCRKPSSCSSCKQDVRLSVTWRRGRSTSRSTTSTPKTSEPSLRWRVNPKHLHLIWCKRCDQKRSGTLTVCSEPNFI